MYLNTWRQGDSLVVNVVLLQSKSKQVPQYIANKLEKFNDKQFKHYTTRSKRIRGMLADWSQHKETKDQTKIKYYAVMK